MKDLCEGCLKNKEVKFREFPDGVHKILCYDCYQKEVRRQLGNE